MDLCHDVVDGRSVAAHGLGEALAPAGAAVVGEIRTHDAEDQDRTKQEPQHDFQIFQNRSDV